MSTLLLPNQKTLKKNPKRKSLQSDPYGKKPTKHSAKLGSILLPPHQNRRLFSNNEKRANQLPLLNPREVLLLQEPQVWYLIPTNSIHVNKIISSSSAVSSSPKLNEIRILDVSIPVVEDIETNEKFTLYHVEVKVFNGDDEEVLRTQLRFSEMTVIHDLLRKNHPGLSFPKLPSKLSFNFSLPFSKESVDKKTRKAELEVYLKKVYNSFY